MGSRFDITVVAESAEDGDAFIQSAIEEITRIEQLISSWDPHSLTSEVNANAGITPVEVDQELFDLISRSKQISQLTDGAFDISYASMDRIWKFDGSMSMLPSEDRIAASVAKVGFQNIQMDVEAGTVFLPLKGMKIGFGGIGKGYAADMAKQLLRDQGATAGIINASGDMNTWGTQPDGTPWTVAITNPMNKNESFATLPIQDQAVVTSGNYEKYVEIEGQHYAHIIDPRTGMPSQGIVSVTVFGPSAELADALATATFVMGIEVGIDRIEQLKGMECIIVDDQGKLHVSSGININN